jgi:hypothetical protein
MADDNSPIIVRRPTTSRIGVAMGVDRRAWAAGASTGRGKNESKCSALECSSTSSAAVCFPIPNPEDAYAGLREELTEWEEQHEPKSHADSVTPEDPSSVLASSTESVVVWVEAVVVRPVRERVRLMVEEDLGLVEGGEGS